jgi:hypothetical protein
MRKLERFSEVRTRNGRFGARDILERTIYVPKERSLGHVINFAR